MKKIIIFSLLCCSLTGVFAMNEGEAPYANVPYDKLPLWKREELTKNWVRNSDDYKYLEEDINEIKKNRDKIILDYRSFYGDSPEEAKRRYLKMLRNKEKQLDDMLQNIWI